MKKKAGGSRRPLLLFPTATTNWLLPLLRGLAGGLLPAAFASGLLSGAFFPRCHGFISTQGVLVPTDPPVDRRRCGQAPKAPAARSSDLDDEADAFDIVRRVSTNRERSSTPMRRASRALRRARTSRRAALGAHVVHRRPPRLRCYGYTTCCTTRAARDSTLTRMRAMQERRADECRRADN